MTEKRQFQSTYIVQDRSNLDEMKRLSLQEQGYSELLGGPLPEQSLPSSFHRVLDVACGTGGWVIEMAQKYPQLTAIGVDISGRMIEYARTQAQQVNDRIEFHVMDALLRLDFPNEYFDLVNIRLGISFLRTWDWPKLLQEFHRVTRPGGMMRIVESEIKMKTTSSSLNTLYDLLCSAFDRAGHFFPEQKTGITSQLALLLTRYGHVQNIEEQHYTLTYQPGSPHAQSFLDDLRLIFKNTRPFLQKWINCPANYEEIYQQALVDMIRPDFRISNNTVIAWGWKGGGFVASSQLQDKTPLVESVSTPTIDDLSSREKEVLAVLATGAENQEIAEALGISIKTVGSHLSSLYKKTHISSRSGLIRFALEMNRE